MIADNTLTLPGLLFTIMELQSIQVFRENPSWIRYSSIGTDDVRDGEVVVIASRQGLLRLANSKRWIGNGTFGRCPFLFNQLVRISLRIYTLTLFLTLT